MNGFQTRPRRPKPGQTAEDLARQRLDQLRELGWDGSPIPPSAHPERTPEGVLDVAGMSAERAAAARRAWARLMSETLKRMPD